MRRIYNADRVMSQYFQTILRSFYFASLEGKLCGVTKKKVNIKFHSLKSSWTSFAFHRGIAHKYCFSSDKRLKNWKRTKTLGANRNWNILKQYRFSGCSSTEIRTVDTEIHLPFNTKKKKKKSDWSNPAKSKWRITNR